MKDANYNTLISLLKHRLAASTKQHSHTKDGYSIYVDYDIYSISQLVAFIDLSLSEFNSIPEFTFFTLDDDNFVKCFSETLVEGAALYALSSQALLERGREFRTNDNGITFVPPNISELLNTQYRLLLDYHFKKIKLIKENIHQWNYK